MDQNIICESIMFERLTLDEQEKVKGGEIQEDSSTLRPILSCCP